MHKTFFCFQSWREIRLCGSTWPSAASSRPKSPIPTKWNTCTGRVPETGLPARAQNWWLRPSLPAASERYLSRHRFYETPFWAETFSEKIPRANPTIASYNASAVKMCNATGSLARFENKNILWNTIWAETFFQQIYMYVGILQKWTEYHPKLQTIMYLTIMDKILAIYSHKKL
jgi:hypothetical protein